MKVEIGLYRNNFDFIKHYYEREIQIHKDVVKIISELSVATGVPVIVVAHYIGEIHGYTDEVNNTIKNLIEFYGYKEIKE